MKILSLLVLFCLVNVGSAQWRPQKPTPQPKHVQKPDNHFKKPVHSGAYYHQNYHLKYGHAFPANHYMAGYMYYNGYNHHHWSNYWFDVKYNCWLYYCSYTNQTYYWHSMHFRYYPLGYFP